MPDRLCVDRICETLEPGVSGVVYPSVTLGPLSSQSSSPGRGLHADISVCAQPGYCQHMLLPSLPLSLSPARFLPPNLHVIVKTDRVTLPH